MNQHYRNATANHGAALITHIGLVDVYGVEPSGGAPAYRRLAVRWTEADDGTIRPKTDLTFNIPPGCTIAGWRGFSAASGGTDFGGADLAREQFYQQGEFVLLAAQTSIHHGGPR